LEDVVGPKLVCNSGVAESGFKPNNACRLLV
jgi:hypothetical protein